MMHIKSIKEKASDIDAYCHSKDFVMAMKEVRKNKSKFIINYFWGACESHLNDR